MEPQQLHTNAVREQKVEDWAFAKRTLADWNQAAS